MGYDITASIVLYESKFVDLDKAVNSFLESDLKIKIYLIDNSPTDVLKNHFRNERIEYIFNLVNLGFGRAHNMALRKAMKESKYHLVLNPDVYFERGVLDSIYSYMNDNGDVGHVMPKILYPDKKVQYLCKLLPSPFDLIGRRFLRYFPYVKRRDYDYELRGSGYNKIMNVPYLSGCFMFLRTEALKKVGIFDERIFMYIEDADLTRRIHKYYKTIFYPHVSVYHHYAKGSYKSLKLMCYHIHGAWIYFNKWGWVFDREKKKINRLAKSKYCH